MVFGRSQVCCSCHVQLLMGQHAHLYESHRRIRLSLSLSPSLKTGFLYVAPAVLELKRCTCLCLPNAEACATSAWRNRCSRSSALQTSHGRPSPSSVTWLLPSPMPGIQREKSHFAARPRIWNPCLPLLWPLAPSICSLAQLT